MDGYDESDDRAKAGLPVGRIAVGALLAIGLLFVFVARDVAPRFSLDPQSLSPARGTGCRQGEILHGGVCLGTINLGERRYDVVAVAVGRGTWGPTSVPTRAHDRNDGLENTDRLLVDLAQAESAARTCAARERVAGGSWYLPAIAEIGLAADGFGLRRAWSSTDTYLVDPARPYDSALVFDFLSRREGPVAKNRTDVAIVCFLRILTNR